MGIGVSMKRVDAYEKVTGRAKYTDDLAPKDALVAVVVRSTIANGLIKSFDMSEAEKVPGVVKIFTCFDVPQIKFPTPGHPWSTDISHQDVSDRMLLNRRVRIYGDDIAAVVAQDRIAADKAARLVKVEYEEYPVYTRMEDSMADGAVLNFEEYKENILKKTCFKNEGASFDDAAKEDGIVVVEGLYDTQTVQHCHIEPPVSFAYMANGKIVVVSSTQIPHIVRRVCGQALGIPWGKVRVIKPYIGGGFGNKQEVLYEPLNAWLTSQLGGRAVKLELTREETFAFTRVRHAMQISLKTAVRKDGQLVARKCTLYSNQGGYASHGHAIVMNATSIQRMLYHDEKAIEQEACTVFTNISTGGAMRGYGIPQWIFALESHMDDVALKIGMDPIEFRKKNHMRNGFKDPGTGIPCHSIGLAECIEKGKKYIKWDEKRKAYANRTGDIRYGVGMAIFCYKSCVAPIALETASCRIVLNQDGSVQVQMGATEIGQGIDTAYTQMAAETLGISADNVYVISTQDTDVTPFDPAAYASRQAYISGTALKQTAEIFVEKVLAFASKMLDKPCDTLLIKNNSIVDKNSGDILLSMENLAMEAFYSLTDSVHITAESTYHSTDNTYSFGACFVEIEIDIPVGKIKVLDIINVHDSGVLINPALAEAQVHGGMSMSLGFGLSEQLLFDGKARPLNNNLLDYKLPTSVDTPELAVDFVETVDPTGPYGNKALGETPALPSAPAIRNALLYATGVAVNSLPMNPQKLVEHFKAAGIICKDGGK